jgi:hypothetical protein
LLSLSGKCASTPRVVASLRSVVAASNAAPARVPSPSSQHSARRSVRPRPRPPAHNGGDADQP